jgi:hypothetical protein
LRVFAHLLSLPRLGGPARWPGVEP